MKQLYVARPNKDESGHDYVRLIELDWWDIIQLLFGAELEAGSHPLKVDAFKIRRT
jgi:hypothetical protein